mmetsp:Transcript_7820/g.9764  ORF Transcript_7820/g.9764 Transcript_7820/m.9764 type:complete len:81 (-) Transcript_7820:52-294(-)
MGKTIVLFIAYGKVYCTIGVPCLVEVKNRKVKKQSFSNNCACLFPPTILIDGGTIGSLLGNLSVALNKAEAWGEWEEKGG